MTLIFVSHSTDDAVIARQVADAIRQSGEAIWIAPDSIPPGQAYNEAIVAGLRDSDVLAVLVSRAANASRHVAREVGLADNLGKRIVPIRIEPVEPSDGLSYYLNLPQWVEWHTHGPAALAPMIAMLRAPAPGPAVPRPPLASPPAEPFRPPAAPPVSASGVALIRVHRPKMLSAAMRKLAILVDGQKVGEIGAGETLDLQVPAGRRELAARIDWAKSEPFPVDAAAGGVANVQVSTAEVANIGGQLAGLLGSSGYFSWTRLD